MRVLRLVANNRSGAAAAELAMVMPFMLALLFGAVEAGNYFLNEHAVAKQVRDGARFAARLPLVETYSCPSGEASGSVIDAVAEQRIINVTTTGSTSGTAAGRLGDSVWSEPCGTAPSAVSVSVRCLPLDDYPGIYRGLESDIPVVKVAADVEYPSVLGTLGFDTSGVCLRAESEVPVAGL